MSVSEVQDYFKRAITIYGIEEVCKQSDLSQEQIDLILSGVISKDVVFFLADYLDVAAENIPITQAKEVLDIDKEQDLSNGHLV